jgi:hypothetical protein
MHHCANEKCRKIIPSCAVCLQPMDMLNPYIELKRQQNKAVGKNMDSNYGALLVGNLGLGMQMNLGGGASPNITTAGFGSGLMTPNLSIKP